MALGHAVSDETEEAYRRGDALQKRAKLMADWSAYCTTTPLDKVVPLHKSAQYARKCHETNMAADFNAAAVSGPSK